MLAYVILAKCHERSVGARLRLLAHMGYAAASIVSEQQQRMWTFSLHHQHPVITEHKAVQGAISILQVFSLARPAIGPH